MLTSPTALLRQLKGAPLSVLFALAISGQPTGEKWLIAATGYSQNKVREALLHLQTNDLAIRSNRFQGWQLANGARQLPFTFPDLVEVESQKLTLAPTTATTAIVQQNDSKSSSSKNESQKMTLANLDALRSAGIHGTTAARLASLDHVNPEFIRAHADRARQENKSIGILICRIRDGDQLPQEENSYSRYISGEFAEFIEH